MKRKSKIIIAILILISFVLAFMLIRNEMYGNNRTKNKNLSIANNYLEKHYPNEGFEISEVKYSSKSGNYEAICKIKGSKDRHFDIVVNKKGKILCDNYENINNLNNTSNRISREHKSFIKPYLDEISKNYSEKSGMSSRLIFYEDYIESFPELYNERKIKISSLEIDKEYDEKELSAKLGSLVVYIETEDSSIKNASDIILNIKNELDKEEISFQEIDFTMVDPLINSNKIEFTITKELICDDKEKLANIIEKRIELYESLF